MTPEQAQRLEAGDQIMITTSDGMGGNPWGTIFRVLATNDEGILIGGNILITDVRRVDLYRKAKPEPVKRAL